MRECGVWNGLRYVIAEAIFKLMKARAVFDRAAKLNVILSLLFSLPSETVSSDIQYYICVAVPCKLGYNGDCQHCHFYISAVFLEL